jgi:transcriptional regulator with XRE-family HTH domain
LYLIIDIWLLMYIMRNIMPARPNNITPATVDKLAALGQQIRAYRKALSISATTLAEAAGMSRITLHRIEAGEPAVTMGAYFNAMTALGIHFGIVPIELPEAAEPVRDDDRHGWIPARIKLADYPQLKQLAWQVHGTDELTPREALGIYQRNWRHLDESLLTQREKELIEALNVGLGERHTESKRVIVKRGS